MRRSQVMSSDVPHFHLVTVIYFLLQVTELECVSGQTTVIKSQKTELNQTIEELELALRAKEEVRSPRSPRPRGKSAETKRLSCFILIFKCSVIACRSWRDLKQRW